MNAAFRAPGDRGAPGRAGCATRPNTVAEFAAFRETQIAFFAEMVKTANIRIE